MMEKLNTGEMELVLRWFEQHMTMEQRHQLMAEMPVFYAKMAGNRSPQMAGVLSEYVRAAVDPLAEVAEEAGR
jgi:hypothetical protein